MPKTFVNNINLNFSYPGWHQCQVTKVLESFSVIIFLWGRIGFATSAAASTFKFPSTLPGQDLKPTLSWMEADISTQSAQSSIEKNTVPCIPAGPKSCLVRKMAWSWYSAWSGSRRCCVLAHRHTCSRLRDGLPRSIRHIDCKEYKDQEECFTTQSVNRVSNHGGKSSSWFTLKDTALVKVEEQQWHNNWIKAGASDYTVSLLEKLIALGS